MDRTANEIKQEFIEGMSGISAFWGLPKGMGAIFGVLYLAPAALSLDELTEQTGLTKGAISTHVRALARMGLIHPVTRLGDRKDYYAAESDFFKAMRSILAERQNAEFDRSIASVQRALSKLTAGEGDFSPPERAFLIERLNALQAFFDALDNLTRAVSRLEGLGFGTVQNILRILK
jgi:DNA-binding transcriptional regulator GbsR (MarR family)